jgi:putative FmdB family regulatory protein
MPLYEYRCTKCNHKFEVYHDVGGTAGPCPVCGGEVKRVFSSVGLIFKGSGFHTTDYRKSPSTDGAKQDGATKSEETPKTDLKTDKKAEQKPDKKAEQKSEKKAEPKTDKKS